MFFVHVWKRKIWGGKFNLGENFSLPYLLIFVMRANFKLAKDTSLYTIHAMVALISKQLHPNNFFYSLNKISSVQNFF